MWHKIGLPISLQKAYPMHTTNSFVDCSSIYACWLQLVQSAYTRCTQSYYLWPTETLLPYTTREPLVNLTRAAIPDMLVGMLSQAGFKVMQKCHFLPTFIFVSHYEYLQGDQMVTDSGFNVYKDLDRGCKWLSWNISVWYASTTTYVFHYSTTQFDVTC